MTSNEITLTVVASIFGLVATILSIITFFKNSKKESTDDAKETTADFVAVKTDVSYIKDGITELKSMMKAQTEKQFALELKLQKVEDKVNDVDKRMQKIERYRAVKLKKETIK